MRPGARGPSPGPFAARPAPPRPPAERRGRSRLSGHVVARLLRRRSAPRLGGRRGPATSGSGSSTSAAVRSGSSSSTGPTGPRAATTRTILSVFFGSVLFAFLYFGLLEGWPPVSTLRAAARRGGLRYAPHRRAPGDGPRAGTREAGAPRSRRASARRAERIRPTVSSSASSPEPAFGLCASIVRSWTFGIPDEKVLRASDAPVRGALCLLPRSRGPGSRSPLPSCRLDARSPAGFRGPRASLEGSAGGTRTRSSRPRPRRRLPRSLRGARPAGDGVLLGPRRRGGARPLPRPSPRRRRSSRSSRRCADPGGRLSEEKALSVRNPELDEALGAPPRSRSPRPRASSRSVGRGKGGSPGPLA